MNQILTIGELKTELRQSEKIISDSIQKELSRLYIINIQPSDINLNLTTVKNFGSSDRIILSSVKISVNI